MINTIQKTKIPGWFSEPKNIATTFVGLSLAAGLMYGFLTFVLPWLVTVTWNLVNLVVGGIILGFLLMVIGLPLNSGLYWGFVMAPFYVLTMNRLVIEWEESYLEKKFRDVYRGYKARVRRWL